MYLIKQARRYETCGKAKQGGYPKKGEKNGRLITSHRYNHLPLLSSDPGGVQQELAV
jgi:hypothetical protein